jgi:hypothetical protein
LARVQRTRIASVARQQVLTPGVWTLRGVSNHGIAWTADLMLKSDLSGTLVWKKDGSRVGNEDFRGSYNAKTRQLTLVGYQKAGEILNGTYKATLSEDGRRLIAGTWVAPEDTGTWVAEWVKPAE